MQKEISTITKNSIAGYLTYFIRKKKLLDIDCGSGWLLKEAEKSGLETYGLDISNKAVERAKINAPNSEILVGDGENLPWSDNYFDYISCLGSLEHYVNPERGVKEIQRVLRGKCLKGYKNS